MTHVHQLVHIMTVTTATICAADPNALWQILQGKDICEIVDDGRCVTDGPDEYGNNERCVVKALRPLFLTAEQYDVETGYDFVTVDGAKFTKSAPQAVYMNAGKIWVWKSDGFETREGYKLCAQLRKFICMHVRCLYLLPCFYVFAHV